MTRGRKRPINNVAIFLAFLCLVSVKVYAQAYESTVVQSTIDKYGVLIGTHGRERVMAYITSYDVKAIGEGVRYVPTTSMLVKDRNYPWLPFDMELSPYNNTIMITGGDDSKSSKGLLNGWIRVIFPLNYTLYFDNPELMCARQAKNVWIWDKLCFTDRMDATQQIGCHCPVRDGQVSVTLLNPGAFCPYSPPSAKLGNFYCENGHVWVALHNMIGQTYDLFGPVESTKNVTAQEVIFHSVNGSLMAECINTPRIIINLSDQEKEAIEEGLLNSTTLFKYTNPSCGAGTPLVVSINSSSPCIGNHTNLIVPVLTSSPEYLNVTFQLSSVECEGGYYGPLPRQISPSPHYDNTWWVVLVSVFGGIFLCAVFFVIICLVPPIRDKVQDLMAMFVEDPDVEENVEDDTVPSPQGN